MGSPLKMSMVGRRRWRTVTAGLAPAFLLAIHQSVPSANAAGRVALVLDAENYSKLGKSPIGLSRGTELAQALRQSGFDVIESDDPSNAETRAHLRDFIFKVPGADVGLIVLIGHGIATGGQTFFLPANVEISRATDLMSRGLSITNLAQIVSSAQTGSVIFLMSVPKLEAPIENTDSRPQLNADTEKNVTVSFSASSRVPASRIDSMTAEAADALIKSIRTPDATLGQAIKAVSVDGMGLVVGSAPDIPVAAPLPPPHGVDTASTGAGNSPEADTESRLRSEKAKADEARANAERTALESRQIADQALAKLNDEEARLNAMEREHRALMGNGKSATALKSDEEIRLEAIEREHRALMSGGRTGAARMMRASSDPGPDNEQPGKRQRTLIQERLRKLGLYMGKIDSVLGPLTREAIMGYQKSRAAAVTGYLTPDQFDDLTSDDSEGMR